MNDTLESDIIEALTLLASFGYPVVHVWQVQMWLPERSRYGREVIRRRLNTLQDSGKLERVHYRGWSL